MKNALIAAALSAALPSAADPHEVHVSVVAQQETVPLAGAEIVLSAVSTVGREVRATISRDGFLAVRLPAGGLWELTCRGRDLWCPRIAVDLARRSRVTLPAYRAARLVGKLRPPLGVDPPRRFVVQGRLRYATGSHATIMVTASVTGHRLEFVVPRTPLDLRLTAGGWAPVYLWALDPRGSRQDLGVIELKSGGSISGHVTEAESANPVARARVTLAPAAAVASESDRERLTVTTSSTTADERGFFQMAGLAPGRYRLDVTQGARVFSDLVEVPPDSEVRLGELRVGVPGAVEFQLEPRTPPEGQRWIVIARALNDAGKPLPEGRRATTDDEGIARVSRIVPGPYEVQVQTQDGRRFHWEQLPIGGEERISLQIPIVKVRGVVRRGKDPLQGRLVFETGSGDQSACESDEGGRFEGWIRMPERAFLVVGVQASDPPLSRQLELARPEARDGVIELDIRLEEREIVGTVFGEDGRPLPGAEVVAASRVADWSSTLTDAEGRYRLTGLAPEPHEVWAVGENGRSAAEDVDVTSRNEPVTVDLVVRNGRSLRGRVLSAEGLGVPGARLAIEFPSFGGSTVVRTDVEGGFELTVPTGARVALVRARAKTHFLWSSCVPLPEGESIWVLSLPRLPASSLTLDMPGTTPAQSSTRFLLTGDGGVLSMGDLFSWVVFTPTPGEAGTGTAWPTVGGVAPGTYALVADTAVTWRQIVARACAGAPFGSADWTTVGPGASGTVRLTPAQ